MRNISNRLIVATALLLLVAGLLWFGGNLYLSGQAQRAVVLSAAVDIPPGTVVTAEMLASLEVPRGTEENYLASPEEAEGRVARVYILAGTALTGRMLTTTPPPPGRLLPSGAVVSPGKRAIALEVNALDLAGGALRVGDHVAIYPSVILSATTAVIPRPLVEHVRVLDLYTPQGTSLLSQPAGRQADVVLLEADPALADLLMEASRQGKLRLVLEGGEP